MFPGIGDHYVGMGHGLYESWDVFRQEVDRCAQILDPYLGTDIRKIIYPDGQRWNHEGNSRGIDLKQMLGRSTDAPKDDHATDLNKTLFAQPALFTVEYAMARLWQSFGIIPPPSSAIAWGNMLRLAWQGCYRSRRVTSDRLPRQAGE